MATLMRCENCEKQIKLEDDFAGKSIRCPRCQQVVQVRGQRQREEDDDDRREQRRGRSRKQKSGSVALWVGLGVGGAALVLTAVAVVVVVAFVGTRAPIGPNAVVGKPAVVQGGPAEFPEFGPARLIQPGVLFQEAVLWPGALPMKVWYYRLEQAKGKLPLVLVPPAGSTLLAGMALGDGDRIPDAVIARGTIEVGRRGIDGQPLLRIFQGRESCVALAPAGSAFALQ